MVECAVAAAISSLMDIDHFIVAKSIHLEDAVGQKNRPLLHNTLLPFGILFLSTLLGRFLLKGRKLFSKGLLIFSSMFSHHLRDGSRRGLWLWGGVSIQLS